MSRLTFDIFARDEASKTFDKVGESSGKLGTRLAGVGKVAGAGLLGLGAAAIGIGPKLLDVATNLEAVHNKVNIVFGKGAAGDVKDWADEVAEKMGLTTSEAQGMAAGLGDLLIPMGFSKDKAMELSLGYANLAGALSQWSNGKLTATDASDMLSDAMMGEYDSLKSVGVQLDATTVQQLMHAKGYDKLTGAAQKQKQAEVVLAEIQRQSSSAITAYDQNTNKLALSKNRLSSKVKELRDGLAKGLTPALTKVMEWTDKVASSKGFHNFLTGAKDVGMKLWAFFNTNLLPVLKQLWNNFTDAAGKVLPAIRGAFDSVRASLEKHPAIINTIKAGVQILGSFISNVAVPAIVKGWKMVGPVFEATATVLDKVVIPAVRFLLKTMLGVFDGVLGAAAKAFGWLPLGIGDSLKDAAAKVHQFRKDTDAQLDAITKPRKVTITPSLDQTAAGDVWRKLNGFATRVQVPIGPLMPSPGSGPHNAGGAVSWRGGMTYVNERGGEVMDLPNGTRIWPHDQQPKGGSGGDTYQITILGGSADPAEVARQVVIEINKERKRNGNNRSIVSVP